MCIMAKAKSKLQKKNDTALSQIGGYLNTQYLLYTHYDVLSLVRINLENAIHRCLDTM